MPHIASLLPRLLATALALVSFASIGWAQPAPTVRIRGTIEAVDGPILAIKSREGTDMKVRMTDNVAVFGVAKTELSDIKAGAYIGVVAVAQPHRTPKGPPGAIFSRTPP